jgi:hypothetical protein
MSFFLVGQIRNPILKKGPVLARTTPVRERAALCSSDPCAVLGRPVPQGRDRQRCGDHHSCHESGTSVNEPSREEHTRSQPAAPIAKGTASPTYAEAVTSSDLSLIPVVKRTRTRPNGRDSPTNAAGASAAADPEMSLTELRHNPAAENAAAAALRTAANAAAAAAKCDHDDLQILRAVLTASALAQTSAQDTVQAHRRGGRPPPMRRANPGARPRRNRRRPTGTAPSHTASQSVSPT